MVLIPKLDGMLRVCVDYRNLDAITVRDTYPIPRLDEYIDSLGSAKMEDMSCIFSRRHQFSGDIEDHFGHVREILKILKGAGVSLKLAKCKFFTGTVQYLGRVMRPGALSVDEARTAAVRGAKPLRTKTEFLSFLGLCNVFRRFSLESWKSPRPLMLLLRKDNPSSWPLWGIKD